MKFKKNKKSYQIWLDVKFIKMAKISKYYGDWRCSITLIWQPIVPWIAY